ncbi:hypothetical protein RRF57_011695 [Xylaria bambusicola]|uniref:Uncharacterized protein n=1 Tax=Xylaria bambusicola TaxID=326684 RepID=A0AAN7UVB7_9PEZI
MESVNFARPRLVVGLLDFIDGYGTSAVDAASHGSQFSPPRAPLAASVGGIVAAPDTQGGHGTHIPETRCDPMLYDFRGRPTQEQPPGAIDKPRLLLATALALEDIPIYATLKAVLIVGKGVEVEANQTFAVSVAQASWEDDPRET